MHRSQLGAPWLVRPIGSSPPEPVWRRHLLCLYGFSVRYAVLTLDLKWVHELSKLRIQQRNGCANSVKLAGEADKGKGQGGGGGGLGEKRN